MKLSVVIPTLNEAQYLSSTIEALSKHATEGHPYEIIVADCGSSDGTPQVAARLRACLVQQVPALDSRASALNAGATHATGDVLLFLDADTIVPLGYDQAIRQALQYRQAIGGAFEFGFDAVGVRWRLIEFLNRIRYRLQPLYYGDQAIFVRTEIFRRVGGYPSRRVMEAADFCRLLRQAGRVVLVRRPLKTSPRRFVEEGFWRVLSKDACLWWLDMIGRDPDRFAQAYQENNRRRGLHGAIH